MTVLEGRLDPRSRRMQQALAPMTFLAALSVPALASAQGLGSSGLSLMAAWMFPRATAILPCFGAPFPFWSLVKRNILPRHQGSAVYFSMIQPGEQL